MKNMIPGNKEKITTPQSIKTDDGKTVIDLPTVAQRFNEFFTGVVSRLLETAGLSTNVRQFSSRKCTSERFTLQPISEKFFLKQLRYLKSNEKSYRIRWNSCTLSEGQWRSYSSYCYIY